MALKKRGFKVDRLLNQEREDRLRLKAEQEQRKASQRQEIEKGSAQPYEDDDESIRSGTTMAPSIPPSPPSQSSVESGKRPSILDQIAKRKSGNGLMGKLPSFMDSMPGAFNSMRNGNNGPSSAQNGSVAARGGGPPDSRTTKEVGPTSTSGRYMLTLSQPSSMDNIRTSRSGPGGRETTIRS